MTAPDSSTAVEATHEAVPIELPKMSPLHAAFHGEIVSSISVANEAAASLAAASGNDATLTEAILAEADPATDLGKALAKKSKILDALSDLEAAITVSVQEALAARKAESGVVDVDALTKVYTDAVKDAKSSITMFKTLLKKSYDESIVDRILATVPEIAGARKASTGGSGSGGTRVRGYTFFVDGSGPVTMTVKVKDKDSGTTTEVERSNIAALANHLSTDDQDVEQETIKETFYHAAGTKVAADLPATVEFTVLDGAGVSRNIKAVKDKAEASDNGAAVEVTAN